VIERLRELLPYLGHRNWVLVVDAAYPLQVGDGIEMLVDDRELPVVLQDVMALLKEAKHIRPSIYMDEELDKLSHYDDDARDIFAQIITTRKQWAEHKLHDELIAEVESAAKSFKVVVIKTKTLVAYSSVFLKLECGYWGASEEMRLRKMMQTGGTN
jgi:D-ribose pyranose/furanose isomerase RbsD